MIMAETFPIATFEECNAKSEKSNDVAEQLIRQHFPLAEKVERYKVNGNDRGTDWIASNKYGFKARIDIKNLYNASGDSGNGKSMLVEIYSVFKNKKIGWTLDESKNTEYILYNFNGVKESYCVAFPQLLLLSKICIFEWMKLKSIGLGPHKVPNRGYDTISTQVPWSYVDKQLTLLQHLKDPLEREGFTWEKVLSSIDLSKLYETVDEYINPKAIIIKDNIFDDLD